MKRTTLKEVKEFIRKHGSKLNDQQISERLGVEKSKVMNARYRLGMKSPPKEIAVKKATRKQIKEEVAHEKREDALRGEIQILRAKNKELIKLANTQERVLEYNRLAIDALPVVPVPKPQKPYTKRVTEAAVLVGSCWHIGEVINPVEMGGLNAYNFDIFVKRFQWVVEKTIHHCTENMTAYDFEELHVLLTGDMVSGIIHEELRNTNDLNIVEQAHLGSLVVAQGLLDLCRAFPKVIVTGVVGNHGRVKEQKYYKGKQQVNWDFIFYNNLALLLKNQPNITFNIPMSFWAGVEIMGHNFHITHGDQMKSWGGIPFYGFNREVGKWTEIFASQKRYFQYYVTSHFHTRAVLQSPSGEKIMNGSLKGGDEYALGLTLYGDPVQLLFGVHRKYGKSWEVPLNAKHAVGVDVRYRYDRSLPLSKQIEFIK